MPGLIKLYSKKQKKVGFSQETAYVTRALRYSTLPKSAVIQMASEDSGVSEAIVGSVYKALEKQVNQMVLNGHSVYWPGIGYISLGIHAKAVKNKDNVSANLIRTVRLRLRLADELKEELKDTALEVDYIDDGEA